VGVLTDGAEWICYHLVGKDLKDVAAITAEPRATWSGWCFGSRACSQLRKAFFPQRARLPSSAYALDRASLATLFETHKKNPTIRLKRMLRSRLLTSALGTQFDDSEDLFIEHTLLSIRQRSSRMRCWALLGLPVEGLNPARY
jgi:hypothetical protein